MYYETKPIILALKLAREYGLWINIGLVGLRIHQDRGAASCPADSQPLCSQLCKVIVCCEIENVAEWERGNYSLFQIVNFSSFSTNPLLSHYKKLIKWNNGPESLRNKLISVLFLGFLVVTYEIFLASNILSTNTIWNRTFCWQKAVLRVKAVLVLCNIKSDLRYLFTASLQTL